MTTGDDLATTIVVAMIMMIVDDGAAAEDVGVVLVLHVDDATIPELDAPIDVTIGPYETYDDELFGYKAVFEAYVTLRDEGRRPPS